MCFGAYKPLPSAASAHLPCHLLSVRQGSSHLPAAKPTASGPFPRACIRPSAPASLVPSPLNHVEPSPSLLPPTSAHPAAPSIVQLCAPTTPILQPTLGHHPKSGGPQPDSSSFSSPTPQFLPETYHQPPAQMLALPCDPFLPPMWPALRAAPILPTPLGPPCPPGPWHFAHSSNFSCRCPALGLLRSYPPGIS